MTVDPRRGKNPTQSLLMCILLKNCKIQGESCDIDAHGNTRGQQCTCSFVVFCC